MEVLFATTNPAKVKKFKTGLENNGVNLRIIDDLRIKLDVNENGKDAIENAFIKAKTYYDATKIISIGMDNNLFLEGVPEAEQPGTFVRRINGKELTDEEMIQHYTNLVKKYGGKVNAKWVYGIVVYNGEDAKKFTWEKTGFYFVDKHSEKINIGYPLDSITIIPQFNKYLVELTKEEKEQYKNQYNNEHEIIDFILKSIR